MSSFVALVGVASTANANATIDLLWNGVDTSATIATSSSIRLDIIYTNDQVSALVSVSIDYSDANGKYSVAGFTNVPDIDDENYSIFSFIIGATEDNGSVINNFNAHALPPYAGVGLQPGDSYRLGTITFHKDGPGVGPFTVQAFFGLDPRNERIDGDNQIICDGNDSSNCTLGSATLNNVPEPGTVSLLALGLTGLALAARRRTNAKTNRRATC